MPVCWVILFEGLNSRYIMLFLSFSRYANDFVSKTSVKCLISHVEGFLTSFNGGLNQGGHPGLIVIVFSYCFIRKMAIYFGFKCFVETVNFALSI